MLQAGGHTIKVTALRGGNEVLEDKFQALVNINACSHGVQVNLQAPLPFPSLRALLHKCVRTVESGTTSDLDVIRNLQYNVMKLGRFSLTFEQQCCTPGRTSAETLSNIRC